MVIKVEELMQLERANTRFQQEEVLEWGLAQGANTE